MYYNLFNETPMDLISFLQLTHLRIVRTILGRVKRQRWHRCLSAAYPLPCCCPAAAL